MLEGPNSVLNNDAGSGELPVEQFLFVVQWMALRPLEGRDHAVLGKIILNPLIAGIATDHNPLGYLARDPRLSEKFTVRNRPACAPHQTVFIDDDLHLARVTFFCSTGNSG